MIGIHLLLLFGICVSLLCDDGQVKIHLKKVSQAYASEESITILSGNVVLWNSPTFVPQETYDTDICITENSDMQYTFLFKDDWEDGSYAVFKGVYNNVIFASGMSERFLETHPVSLLNPIEENESWKVISSTAPESWNTVAFNDDEWSLVDLSAPTLETSGTQYFRKTFTGRVNLAAYELRCKYQYGIVVYLNGNEIYRDNMPQGDITNATQATGSYTSLDYYGIIRSGFEILVSNLLAIELHYQNSEVTSITFNAWLAQYASETNRTDVPACYVVIPEALTGNTDSASDIFDWDVFSTFVSTLNADPYVLYNYGNSTTSHHFTSLHFTSFHITSHHVTSHHTTSLNLTLLSRPQINGIYLLSSYRTNGLPVKFTIFGSNTVTTSSTKVLNVDDIEYTPHSRRNLYALFNQQTYKYYNAEFYKSRMNRLQIPELRMMVCNLEIPSTMTFESNTYTVMVGITMVDIKPSIEGFYNCSITPALPSGLSLSTETCRITGVATELLETTVYSMTSVISPTMNFTGTFTLTMSNCMHNILILKRVYSNNALYETFTIQNSVTNEVIVEENESTTQVNGGTKILRFCIDADRIKLTLGSSMPSWASRSYLYISSNSNGYENNLLRVRYNELLNVRKEFFFNIGYLIGSSSSWQYKMGETPVNWYNDQMPGWPEASKGTYPESTNRVQLYKKQFTIDSLDNIGGIVLAIRYKYAAIVYINGHEVYRNGFTGDLTTTSFTEFSFTSLQYHEISLPLRLVSNALSNVDYLKVGTNTIAIGLLALADTQKTSSFDAVLQLLGDTSTSRLYSYDYASNGLDGDNAMDMDHFGTIYSDSCGDNYLDITFPGERAETITSFSITDYYLRMISLPNGVTVMAQNLGDEEWVTLGTYSGWKWWNAGQEKKIYLTNSKAYMKYRFKNWNSGSTTECSFKVNRFDLYLDKNDVTIPDLAYESLDGYLNVEIAEIFPNSFYYTEFSVNPALPAGLTLDQGTGAIMGTPTAITASREYTISAKKLSGEEKSAVITMGITTCSYDHSLITCTFRTSYNPNLQYYKIHEGRGTSGVVVREEESLDNSQGNVLYADFCLPHNIFTLETGTNLVPGIAFPGGYSLSVDLGTLRYDLDMMSSTVTTSKTLTFSSFLPFQINFDNWFVYRDATDVPSGWNKPDFDDSTWDEIKAKDIGTVNAVTVYLRRTFAIPSLEDYHVLNVHVKYAAGLAAYFNNRLVARFNLPETFNGKTHATTTHDAAVYSKFHVILVTSGVTKEKNVMAFELHRSAEQTTAEPVVFDATGVFGVEDCSPVIDSYSTIHGNTPAYGSLGDIFDLDPYTYISVENVKDSTIEWIVENLEGSKFNSYAFYNGVTALEMGWSFSARKSELDEFTVLHSLPTYVMTDRERVAFDVPVAAASFNEFKWKIQNEAIMTPKFSEIVFQYCVAKGNVCPSIGDYPPVQEGQISPSSCPQYYTGYSYRKCENGVLGDIKLDQCKPKAPANLEYSPSRFVFVIDTHVMSSKPTYTNIITEFYVDASVTLPEGLVLDIETGIISGVPKQPLDWQEFTIYGKNERSATQTTISILIRKGICISDSVFDNTEVGTTAIYDCATAGAYVGTKKRECILGEKDGEWLKASGFCMPVALLITLILVLIIIIAVVIFIVIRITKKRKATGGVRGRKVGTETVVKGNTKEVKV